MRSSTSYDTRRDTIMYFLVGALHFRPRPFFTSASLRIRNNQWENTRCADCRSDTVEYMNFKENDSVKSVRDEGSRIGVSKL
jgi:hypothetical protein